MKIQQSYLNDKPTLFLVPTPIGNFDDITIRSINTLKNVDLIYCEDTRITKILLSHFQINTPLKNYHIFNEKIKVDEIVEILKTGKNIALVTDAGLPCISDPGFLISKVAVEENFNVVCLPGASAGITALAASGLPSERFHFYGFLKSRSSQRKKELEQIKDYQETIIFYEAPHRIKETLQDMYDVFQNRQVVIAREISKKYEEYTRGDLKDILEADLLLKGEMVILVSKGEMISHIEQLNALSIIKHYEHYLDEGLSEKDAMKKVADDRDIPKNEVYKEIKIKEKI